ncbi:type II toxin-antitoxin system death-on-curing family toxin [Stomatobaculum sp. F0698]|uniref:type II toxin-antitoxin system death-on-curing family toxin n=1 Tax=Stomatobaculum sp. F0698 TaxID=3059030 RepID=UPI00272CE70D|nr:type II toxin-antitoxin system death-on-curing family toxin [Stomatobaculum sp. F0698]WLD87196.1 type II toxin-antitoxin system death-on-curing family toxin [Stomatobaculum sp. F0698]
MQFRVASSHKTALPTKSWQNDLFNQKAAQLGIGLTQNHAFIDGNKRIGAHAMLVFPALNQITITYTQKELSDTFLSVAAGQLSFEDLLEWILAHQT